VTTVARAALSKLDLTVRYTVVAKPSTPLTPVHIEQQTIGIPTVVYHSKGHALPTMQMILGVKY